MAEADVSGLTAAVALVGDRWTLLVVEALLAGPLRFGELADGVPGIAPNILTQRLRHLEREALVVAHPYSERPRRFAYELTASGRELAGALRLLAEWGAQHGGDDDRLPRHGACGTPLETRLYCPTCGVAVDEEDIADDYFA
jgi:DNA-binding HxlR family transcriptional regulator